MKKALFLAVILLSGVLFSLVFDVKRVAAQGPAGVGASAAAKDTSHSMNPMNWIKKDSSKSTNVPADSGDSERKLTASLREQGVLPSNATITDACSSFTALNGCLSALHASHNLGLDFNCLRAAVSGVHTNADMSGCKVADGEKALDLSKAIHLLKPDVNAKQATKDADQQAKDDLKAITP
jgi:hypothetical protein